MGSPAEHPDPAQLDSLAAGTLVGPAAEDIRGHLSGCPGCRERVEASLGATRSPGASKGPDTLGHTFESEPRRPSARGDGEFVAGDQIGRYCVLRRVGAGGMGVVYAAYDPELDRRVALKLLRPGTGGTSGKERLLREAQALAKLSHPNVVHVHDVGVLGDAVFVAMELVEGGSLKEWLREPRTWREKRAVMLLAGEGLAAAHRAGLVHRDFKPDNVAVGDDGAVRVLDFGLARAEPAPGPAAPPDASEAGITLAGAILGTPGYMSPEQYRGEPCDARGDQFSFCAAAWYAFFEELPFAGVMLPELSRAAQAGEIRPIPAGSDVPEWIPPVLRKGLAVAPADRYPELARLLEALGRDPVPLWRRALPAVAALGLLAAVAVTLAVASRARHQETDLCSAQAERLQGAWDPIQRERIRNAFDKLPKTFARDEYDRATTQLDQYGQQWGAVSRDACEGARIRKDRSPASYALEVVCLEGRLQALRELSGVLADADSEIAEHAVDAVEALPPVADCAHAERLETWVSPPPPESARAVEGVRGTLARVHALESAGKYPQALVGAQAAVDAAAPLQYPAIRAQALHQQGLIQFRLQQYPAALDTYRAAALEALTARDLTLLTDIWSQATAAAAAGDKLDLAQVYADQARALIDGLSRPPPLEADFQISSGNLKRAKKDLPGALASYQRALELRRQYLGPDHPGVGVALNNVGALYSRLQRFDEAEQVLRAAVALFEKSLGPRHPRLLEPITNLGACLRREGRPQDALPLARRAVDLASSIYGESHAAYGRALSNLALVEKDLGQRQQARHDWGIVIGLREKIEGAQGQGVGNTLGSLAQMDHEDGSCSRAFDGFEHVLRIRRLNPKPDPLALANAMANVGCELLDVHKAAQAGSMLAEAIAGFPKEDDGGDDRGRAGFCYARFLWTKEPARARALLVSAHDELLRNRAFHADDLREVETWMKAHVTTAP